MLPLDQAASAIAHAVDVIGESRLDPDLIAETKKQLKQARDALDQTRFSVMGTIQDTSFGADHAGLDLSKQHGLAHQVMEETLQGVAKDVEEFCANLISAVKFIETADNDAAADLKQVHDWLEKTQYQATHLHGDHAQQQAQQQVQQQQQTPAGDA